MSITRSITGSITGAASAITRYFTPIGAALKSYYAMPNLTADRIVMYVYSPISVNQ